MTNALLYLAIMIVIGFIGSAVAHRIHFPAVTGYLIAGLILGLTGLISKDTLAHFDILADLALGFIALSIGSEFKLDFLKKVGAAPLIITVFEAFGAVLVLDILLIAIGVPLPVALLLGAIGSATAPAATLMVVRQYKADGPVTRMLLPVVAMDDAVALIAFSVSAAVAQMIASDHGVSLAPMLLHPLVEIGGSLIVGSLIGILAALFLRRFKSDGDRLGLAFAVVMGGVGLSTLLGLSSLLVCMMAGAMFANLSKQSVKLFKVTDAVTPPLFLTFFVLSGAELDVGVLKTIGFIGVVYIIGRVFGKVLGSYFGARIARAELVVRNNLGFMLIPQAGVAIGLSLLALRILPEYGATIRAVVLCATLVYELTGPLITKLALIRAGEIEDTSIGKKKCGKKGSTSKAVVSTSEATASIMASDAKDPAGASAKKDSGGKGE
ncbi:MAG: cation:proton antiporter [Clostridiales bacterium]|nr:cation:proton antiporter [Clostridiales bacterium]